jgi:RecB family exonuclease
MARFHSISDSILIVPTATLAEHMSHELARSGGVFRPSRVTTLAGFLEPRAAPVASNFLLHAAVAEALEKIRPACFEAVREYRGFRKSLARLANEIPADAVDGDLSTVFQAIDRVLEARGFATRRRRMEEATHNPGPLPPHIVIDGFFSFRRPELDFLIALASRTAVTVTLPEWPGSAATRGALLARGFREQICSFKADHGNSEVFAALSLEHEVEQIVRRILDEAARGRPFRDIGVIVRTREPYAPALETTFARFGIPARFHFADPLIAHPVIALIAAIVRALLGGWNYEDLLRIAQMPAAGVSDHIEFALRERIPGAGLPIAGLQETPLIFERLASLDSWRRLSLPAAEWRSRLSGLGSFAAEPVIGDQISRDHLRAWQSAVFALAALDKMLSEAAALFDAPLKLADFWAAVETALALEDLRVPDRRANAVHVLDAYEARQWTMPVVFVCGVIDGHFPRFVREHPLLDEASRRRAGLPDAAEMEAEERCLFEHVSTRATEKTIFSYACFNAKGDPEVLSPFLDARGAGRAEGRLHPRPRRLVSPPEPAPIQAPALLAELAKKHAALAPTSVESFLQCPFQFFAAKTLRLRTRPAAPRERLDALLQGAIMHRALAEHSRRPLFGADVFDEVFEEECARAGVPADYRREAVRLEMRRNFEAFLANREIGLGWSSRVEEQFSFALTPQLALRGRIDRLDVGPRNQAIVIDYKYSAANRIRERTGQDEAGTQVQGGLYMLAAVRVFGVKPAGMFYCGLRKGVAWDGWHVPIEGLERAGTVVAANVLGDMMRAAEEKAVQTFDAIVSGEVAARPADEKKCARCDYADICRVETLEALRAATA